MLTSTNQEARVMISNTIQAFEQDGQIHVTLPPEKYPGERFSKARFDELQQRLAKYVGQSLDDDVRRHIKAEIELVLGINVDYEREIDVTVSRRIKVD